MPAWITLMKESDGKVELDPREVDELEKLLDHFGSLRFSGIKQLIDYCGPSFTFLEGPASFMLLDEIARLQWERGKITDALKAKLDDLRKMAAFHSIRIIVARRNDKEKPLLVFIVEQLPERGGIDERAQAALTVALRSMPRKLRILPEMGSSHFYPEREMLLGEEGTRELADEVDYVLSQVKAEGETMSLTR